MPFKDHWTLTGFFIIGAACLTGGLLAIPEIMSARPELLSPRFASILEGVIGLGLVFLMAAVASTMGRVYRLEKEVATLKAKQPDTANNA
jgi:hypothetical protein